MKKNKIVLIGFLTLVLFSCSDQAPKNMDIVIEGRVKIKNYDEVLTNCSVKLQDSYCPFIS